jgi:hypothetical protein
VVEAAGLVLLMAALIEAYYRRRSSQLSMQAYKMRRTVDMRIEQPGSTVASLGAALLDHGMRRRATRKS